MSFDFQTCLQGVAVGEAPGSVLDLEVAGVPYLVQYPTYPVKHTQMKSVILIGSLSIACCGMLSVVVYADIPSIVVLYRLNTITHSM